MKLKITAVPWIIGQLVAVGLFNISLDLAIGSSAVVIVLAVTKNIDWI
jgi:hypothetical protein